VKLAAELLRRFQVTGIKCLAYLALLNRDGAPDLGSARMVGAATVEIDYWFSASHCQVVL
jgi:hypothetical protein